MADVEIVATYELYNINRTKLENLIHRIFDPARLDIEIKDRFGNPVMPREWFLVPVFVVDEAVERIKDGTITDYVYDPKSAKLVNAKEPGSPKSTGSSAHDAGQPKTPAHCPPALGLARFIAVTWRQPIRQIADDAVST